MHNFVKKLLAVKLLEIRILARTGKIRAIRIKVREEVSCQILAIPLPEVAQRSNSMKSLLLSLGTFLIGLGLASCIATSTSHNAYTQQHDAYKECLSDTTYPPFVRETACEPILDGKKANR